VLLKIRTVLSGNLLEIAVRRRFGERAVNITRDLRNVVEQE